jgi:hypothetical protein
MRFFDAERKKNNEFRRKEQKKNLPRIIVNKGEICRKKDACNKSIDDVAVVFSLFPNGIENKKSDKRNRNGIDEKKPPVCFKEPADYINKKRQSPDSENYKNGDNVAVKVAFIFFKAFRALPTVMGT